MFFISSLSLFAERVGSDPLHEAKETDKLEQINY